MEACDDDDDTHTSVGRRRRVACVACVAHLCTCGTAACVMCQRWPRAAWSATHASIGVFAAAVCRRHGRASWSPLLSPAPMLAVWACVQRMCFWLVVSSFCAHASLSLAAGISLKTQILFLIVFSTRYLDIFFNWRILYNVVMKVCVARVCASLVAHSDAAFADSLCQRLSFDSVLGWVALQQGLRQGACEWRRCVLSLSHSQCCRRLAGHIPHLFLDWAGTFARRVDAKNGAMVRCVWCNRWLRAATTNCCTGRPLRFSGPCPSISSRVRCLILFAL